MSTIDIGAHLNFVQHGGRYKLLVDCLTRWCVRTYYLALLNNFYLPHMPQAIASKLAAGLAKIGLVLRHHAWKAGGEHGLAPAQSQVLVLLEARRRGAGMTMSVIAAELAITPASASDTVSALERKGLVARRRDERDARIVRVDLTREGSTLARRAAEWPDMFLSALGELSEQEQAIFVRGLVKIIYSLQSSEQIPVTRMCPTCVYFRPHAHPQEGRPHHCAYVDAPLAEVDLRLDCSDHSGAAASELPRLWQVFVHGAPPGETARAGGFA